MGSPLGPLMANVFMCNLEEKLTRDGLIPHLYRRYVDDTLARMPNTDAATVFLTTLNGLHPSLSFTMEFPVDDRIPFIGIEIIKNGTKLETQVYRKPTNTAQNPIVTIRTQTIIKSSDNFQVKRASFFVTLGLSLANFPFFVFHTLMCKTGNK